MPTPPIGSRGVASDKLVLARFPSLKNLNECREVADTFSDLRHWLRQAYTSNELTLAGKSLSLEERAAVFSFLERVKQDPIRGKVAKELLSKLSTNEAWCTSPRKPNAGVRSASVSGAPLLADPIRHSLAEQFLGKEVMTSFAGCVHDLPCLPSLKCKTESKCDSVTLPSDPLNHSLAEQFLGKEVMTSFVDHVSESSCASLKCSTESRCDSVVTRTFLIPNACHHLLVGKQGKQIAELERCHRVAIRVPKPEEQCDAVAVSGSTHAVEECRKALEGLLLLPIGEEPLHVMTLAVPQTSYGAIIGEHGVILQKLMSDCRVLIQVPKLNQPGNVTLHGHLQGCIMAKKNIEEILRDSVLVLTSGTADSSSIPLPPSYDLRTSQPLRRCLFFPDNMPMSSHDGLSSLETFLKFLDSSRSTCDACVFTITDNRIARRLLDAHRYRKVKVRIITDKMQSEALGSDIAQLQEAGIEVRMNMSDYHMHHKFCILDSCVLMNGSFNWTQGACESNRENVMITNDQYFVASFCAQFDQLWQDYLRV